MPNTAATSQASLLIDTLKDMASGKMDAVRLGEIAAMAAGMDEAGQFVEACNVLGMAAALRGDTFEVERRFNAALQRGGNDAWTLGNYAAALNILASGLHGRECERPCRPARDEQEHHRPQFFDAMPGYFYTLLHRPDGSYLIPLASDAIRDLYGLGPEATTNDYSELLALVHPDDVAPRQRKLDESERDLSPFHAEYRIVLPRIGARWVEAHALPKRTGDGGTRWDGFINDITERKRMEDELRLKEFVLDQARIGVYLIDGNARITYVNDAACRALGYSREELLTKTTMDINDDHSGEVYMAVHQKVLAEGACTFETRHVRRDGSLLPVEIWASRLEYQGNSIGVALAVDITERKSMEAELAARVRDFRSLAENIPDNVARWDAEGRLLYSNPTHQRTLGKPLDEIIGRTLGEIFPDGYFASLDEALASVVATGQEVRIPHVSVSTPGGGMAFHDVRLAPEFDAQGSVVSVLGLGRDMTDIYRMQEAIAEREQEFRNLAESSPDFIVRYDRDGRSRYLNTALLRLLGVSSIDEVAGKRPSEVWPDGRFDLLEQAAARAVETGCNEVIELIVPVGSGEGSISQIFVVPERDVSGQIVGTIAFGRDISAIKGMQRQLTQFVANLPGFAYSFRMSPDGHGSFPFASPGIEKLYGLKPADVKDDMAPLHALAHSDDAPRIIAAIAESARTMTPIHVEYRICRPGLPERWAEFRSSPVREADGSVVWHGIMLDIAERKQTEILLVQREREFRSLAESLPDNIVRYDREGVTVYVNPVLEWTLGDVAAAMIGTTPREYHADGAYEDYAQLLDIVLASGEAGELEKVLSEPDGKASIHQIRMVPERGENGEVVGVLAIGRDITERKRAEQALEDSRTQLRGLIAQREEAREEERRYIAREIHDNLGQILSGLRLNVSRFARRYATNSAEMQAHLRNTGELVDLAVQEVRNISAALRPAELDMDILFALSSHLERFGAYTGIACELHAGDDVDLTEEAHKLALFRIAQESLTNVARHAQASKVEITLRMETPHCILCIRDNGVGFDTGANKPKSFGLAGMRERVAMLGGSVIINSGPGKGTEIVVRIPVQKIMEKS